MYVPSKVKENRYWMSVLRNDDFIQEQSINFDYDKYWKSVTPKEWIVLLKVVKSYFDRELIEYLSYDSSISI